MATARFWIVLGTASAIFASVQSATSSPSSIRSGKALVEKNGCMHCHIVEGDGGTVAPPLDGISEHRDKLYIIGRIANKSLDRHVGAPYPLPDFLMKHVKVSRSEADEIADYLLSLPDREAKMKAHGNAVGDSTPAGSHFKPLKPNESTRRGATLYADHGCAACHSIAGHGGHEAPDLAGVGIRRSKEFISNRISNGAILLPQPGGTATKFAMPPSNLSKEQVKQLTDFLLTLPASNKKSKT